MRQLNISASNGRMAAVVMPAIGTLVCTIPVATPRAFGLTHSMTPLATDGSVPAPATPIRTARGRARIKDGT